MITLLSLVFIAVSSTYIQSADQDEFNKSLFIDHPLIHAHGPSYVNLDAADGSSHGAALYCDAWNMRYAKNNDFSHLPAEQIQAIRAYSIIHLVEAYKEEVVLSKSPIYHYTSSGTFRSYDPSPTEKSKELEKDLKKLLEGTSLSQDYYNLRLACIDLSPEDMLAKEGLGLIVHKINQSIKNAPEEKKPGITTKPAKK